MKFYSLLIYIINFDNIKFFSNFSELNSHVDTVQGEIDYLKEMLKGEGYNFDTNSLPWVNYSSNY